MAPSIAACGRCMGPRKRWWRRHTKSPVRSISCGAFINPSTGYGMPIGFVAFLSPIVLLAQLGASVETDQRIGVACSHLLEQALTENGQFSTNGTPSGTRTHAKDAG